MLFNAYYCCLIGDTHILLLPILHLEKSLNFVLEKLVITDT